MSCDIRILGSRNNPVLEVSPREEPLALSSQLGTSTNSTQWFQAGNAAKAARTLYASLAGDRRYRHYVRVPERNCRCLDLMRVRYNRSAAKSKLHCFYLFIGVVDDAIDLIDASIGDRVLQRLRTGAMTVDTEATRDPVAQMTEILKSQWDPTLAAQMIRRFGMLHSAVMAERRAVTFRDYVQTRRVVGRLTADLSYLLIEPCLEQPNQHVRGFMRRVGAVGCLVDSLFDWNIDHRKGLFRFRPRFFDRVRLGVLVVRCGMPLAVALPRAIGLFAAEAVDTLLDRQIRSDHRGRSRL